MIWLLMVDDRRKDPEAHPYAEEAAAIAAAEETARELGLAVYPRAADDDPWRFLAVGPEGDGVWVVGKEVIS